MPMSRPARSPNRREVVLGGLAIATGLAAMVIGVGVTAAPSSSTAAATTADSSMRIDENGGIRIA
jgi:ferric-dicitrate binding protein FerR (iron transport regulator)